MMCFYPYHNRSDISSVPTPDIVKQQFSFPKDNEIQDARCITHNVFAIWKIIQYVLLKFLAAYKGPLLYGKKFDVFPAGVSHVHA